MLEYELRNSQDKNMALQKKFLHERSSTVGSFDKRTSLSK